MVSSRDAGPDGVAGTPETRRGGHPAGVYVHIPFCAHRCDYCDFATWTDRAHVIDDYVDACITDVERRVTAGTLPPVTSVFFGGGTPSLLPAVRLASILGAIPRVAEAEVTVECNPDSTGPEQLATIAAAGVNRVSIGVQSMRPHVLRALNRTHDPDNVARAVDAARAAGIDRVNLDLIYGTPGETVADWEATLEAALALAPEHLSAYALTVEPGTPLGRAVAAGTAPAPDDDDQADKYVVADERLTEAGLAWYEISNWALPGGECRHNRLYWSDADYVAIGCAAHGKTGPRRWWNVRTPERYVEAIRCGEPVEAGSETLPGPERRRELLGLALRTRDGLAPDAVDPAVRAELTAAGLLADRPDRVVLTRSGRLLATEITVRLVG
jgi:putative oxygen-independent coproporphyrinogen III oxidase